MVSLRPRGEEPSVRYFHFCAHEQFPPDALLEQAVAAERAGFDGLGCSDHLQPWWEPGSPYAVNAVVICAS